MPPTPPRKGIFYGWWIVVSGALLSVIAGGLGYYGFGVFFNPIRQEFGWTAAAVAGAFSIQRLEAGVAGPIVGWAIDRFGPRPVALVGVIVAGLGFILMSRINSLWTFYGAFLVSSTGLSAGGFMVVNTAIANWFVRRRGRALALSQTGYGVSGFVAPVLAFLIARYTWQETLVLAGLAWWIAGIPLSLTLRHKPEQYGYRPDGDPPLQSQGAGSASAPDVRPSEARRQEIDMTTMEAVRTRSFWLLTGSWIMVSLGIGGVFSLMIPALESYGISRSTAAFGVSLLTLFSLAGRWTFGFLSDVLNPRYVLTLTATLKFIGLLIFANIRSAWMIIPFVLFFSMGFGGDFVVRPTLQANYFGRKAYGTIQGVMSSATTLGGIAAPVFSAWVFDTYGSYRPAFLAVSIFVLLAIPMVLAAKSPLEMREKSVALGR